MARLLAMFVLFPAACLIAGLYGVLHDQVSYTVSPEYFTKFKFFQFDIVGRFSDRAGAVIVGWQASWWMGLVIGVVLIPAGRVIQGTRAYVLSMLQVFSVVAMTTMLVGLSALAVAYATLDENSAGTYSAYGHTIVDNVAFARCGMMHNFSYLGGLLGIVTGGVFIYVKRRRQRRHTPAIPARCVSRELSA